MDVDFNVKDIEFESALSLDPAACLFCVYPFVATTDYERSLHGFGCSQWDTDNKISDIVVSLDTSAFPDGGACVIGMLARVYKKNSANKLRVYAQGVIPLGPRLSCESCVLSECDYTRGFPWLRPVREIGRVHLRVSVNVGDMKFAVPTAPVSVAKALAGMQDEVIVGWDGLCDLADAGGLFVQGGEKNTMPALAGIPAMSYFEYRHSALYRPLPEDAAVALLLTAQAIAGISDAQILQTIKLRPDEIVNSLILTACRLLPASIPYSTDKNVLGEPSDRPSNLNTMGRAAAGFRDALVTGDCEDLAQTGLDALRAVQTVALTGQEPEWVSGVKAIASGLVGASVECAVEANQTKQVALGLDGFARLTYEQQQAYAANCGWGDSTTHNCAVVVHTATLKQMLAGGGVGAAAVTQSATTTGVGLLEGTAFVTTGRRGEPWVGGSELHRTVEAADCASGGGKCTTPFLTPGTAFYRVVYALVLPTTAATAGGRYYACDAATGTLGVPFSQLIDAPSTVSLVASRPISCESAATARRDCIMHHPRLALTPHRRDRPLCKDDLLGLSVATTWGFIQSKEIPAAIKAVAKTTTVKIADGMSLHFYHD